MNRTRLRTANGTPPRDRADPAGAPGGPDDSRDGWLHPGSPGLRASPQAGQPGHGCTAVLRSQPILIMDDGMERGRTGGFELICCECGDNPYLDYSQISPRLQQIRGPYTITEGLAAYARHLGLTCDCPG
jgi:hypothetical protein